MQQRITADNRAIEWQDGPSENVSINRRAGWDGAARRSSSVRARPRPCVHPLPVAAMAADVARIGGRMETASQGQGLHQSNSAAEGIDVGLLDGAFDRQRWLLYSLT